jgi:hypothetical protein
MNTRQKIDLHIQWWEKRNEAPLVHVFAPLKSTRAPNTDNSSPPPSDAVRPAQRKGFGGFDFDTAPDDIVKKIAGIRAQRILPSDNLPVAHVNFGTAFLPALAGAGFEFDGTNIWAHPCAESAEELRVRSFDPSNELWQAYIVRFRRLLESWSENEYLPGPCDIVGPMDCVAAMLGPQNLSMEMLMNPEGVKRAAMDAARLFMEVMNIETRMLQEAGLRDGVVDWMHTWLPGRGRCYSEDFSALCGEAHFREFFLEPNAFIAGQIDTPYLHIHSGATPCMPAILEIPNLKAVELSNDPNGPDLDRNIATGRMIQKAGLSLQMSNWEHPLERGEIDAILGGLDPRGLKITLQASGPEEAVELYEYAKTFHSSGRGTDRV